MNMINRLVKPSPWVSGQARGVTAVETAERRVTGNLERQLCSQHTTELQGSDVVTASHAGSDAIGTINTLRTLLWVQQGKTISDTSHGGSQMAMKLLSLARWPPFTMRIPGTHFSQRLGRKQDHNGNGRLG
jgi:hypothetical protein